MHHQRDSLVMICCSHMCAHWVGREYETVADRIFLVGMCSDRSEACIPLHNCWVNVKANGRPAICSSEDGMKYPICCHWRALLSLFQGLSACSALCAVISYRASTVVYKGQYTVDVSVTLIQKCCCGVCW